MATIPEVGFPQLDGFSMHTNIEHVGEDTVHLWFHNYKPDGELLQDVHVLLIDAIVNKLDVCLDPHLPELASYSVQDEGTSGKKKLILLFKRGEISATFESALHWGNEKIVKLPKA